MVDWPAQEVLLRRGPAVSAEQLRILDRGLGDQRGHDHADAQVEGAVHIPRQRQAGVLRHMLPLRF
jgi:hypothetical protein